MKWQKAPEELKNILDLAMQGVDCERRLMFGYPAYFINRNMFIGLYQEQLFMRLPEPVVSSLKGKTSSPVRNLEPMPGRPMTDYVVIPRELYMDRAKLKRLVGAALNHTKTLKPKEPRVAPPAKKKAGPKPPKP
jgi:TfoX/Sxy family transcriptional regulator of competence genes